MNQKTEIVKYLCQTQMDCFTRMAFGWMFPQQAYIPNWSMDLLGDALMRCHYGQTKRLIINMPPRYLKSFYASVSFPAWALAVNPQLKIMCITGNRELLEEQHQMSLRLMSHSNYRALFPHIRNLKERGHCIQLPHGGQRSGHILSPGSGITGLGADVIIIDDPLPASYANDEKRLEQVNLWYDQNIYQRLNHKADGIIILVMQRFHIKDLTGHLLKQNGWEVLSLPAVAMQDERYHQLFGDRFIRPWGEALNPRIETIKRQKDTMRRIGAKTFMAQYQQKPYPSGEGLGFSGAYRWLTPIGPEMPGIGQRNIAFIHRSQEDIVEDELFKAPLRPLSNDPPLRAITREEWLEWARRRNGLPGFNIGA